MNHLFANVEIKGTLKCSQELLLEGRVEGDVTSSAPLTIGPQGFVKGTINSHSLIVCGQVEGNINVKGRCVVKSTATILGNITATLVSIEAGATFRGRSRVQAQPSSTTPPKQR